MGYVDQIDNVLAILKHEHDNKHNAKNRFQLVSEKLNRDISKTQGIGGVIVFNFLTSYTSS
jgi:hypothetical protein